MAYKRGGTRKKATSSKRGGKYKRTINTGAPLAGGTAKAYKNYKTTNVHDGGAALTFGNKQLAILYNPFSFKNNQPKWPDGLASYSIGRKQQVATEVKGKPDLVFVLFPGMTNWLMAYSSVLPKGTTSGTTTLTNDHVDVVLNHHQHKTFNWKSDGLKWGPQVDSDYSAWRPVSTAVKFKHVNSDEDNEGWFEAIRTSRNTIHGKMGVVYQKAAAGGAPNATVWTEPLAVAAPGKLSVGPANVFPEFNLAKSWMEASQWSMQPSYTVGKLKDIGRYIFQLNQEKTINEFQKIRNWEVDVKSQKNDAKDDNVTLIDTQYNRGP